MANECVVGSLGYSRKFKYDEMILGGWEKFSSSNGDENASKVKMSHCFSQVWHFLIWCFVLNTPCCVWLGYVTKADCSIHAALRMDHRSFKTCHKSFCTVAVLICTNLSQQPLRECARAKEKQSASELKEMLTSHSQCLKYFFYEKDMVIVWPDRLKFPFPGSTHEKLI